MQHMLEKTAVPSIDLHYQEAVACQPAAMVALHVYKAAGSTIDHLVKSVCPRNQWMCYSAGRQSKCGWTNGPNRHNAKWADWMMSGPSEDGEPFVFGAVRDPVEKFVSACAWSRISLDRGVEILRTSGWSQWLQINAETLPQVVFLLSQQSPHQKLPVSYLAHTDELAPTLAYIKARCKSQDTSGRTLTTAQWLADGGGELDMTVNKATHARVVPSREHIRAVCELFRVDYLALALPHPQDCKDLFDGPTGLAQG